MAQGQPRKTERKTNALHEGHRERLRKKWWSDVALEKHEFLELLLFFCISRRNTNEITHALLARFGSLHGVLSASPQELKEVEGVGEQTVLFLRCMSELIARYHEEDVDKSRMLGSREDLYVYLSSLFVGCYQEKVYLLLFNGKDRLLLAEQIGDSFAASSEVSLKKINQLAARYEASSAILAHNHPNGVAMASVQDIKTTKKVREALEMVGVSLVDHIVVTGDRCVSIWEESMQFPY